MLYAIKKEARQLFNHAVCGDPFDVGSRLFLQGGRGEHERQWMTFCKSRYALDVVVCDTTVAEQLRCFGWRKTVDLNRRKGGENIGIGGPGERRCFAAGHDETRVRG